MPINRRAGEPGFHTVPPQPPRVLPSPPPLPSPAGRAVILPAGRSCSEVHELYQHHVPSPPPSSSTLDVGAGDISSADEMSPLAAHRLPCVTFPEVGHLGTLNEDDKNSRFGYSYEGTGLSFSVCPDAWRSIARLGGEAEWWGTKPDNQFVNRWELTKEQCDLLLVWGVKQGYVERVTRWRVSWWDDEFEDVLSSDFGTREEAENEAGFNYDEQETCTRDGVVSDNEDEYSEDEDGEGTTIREVVTYAATERLREKSGIPAGDTATAFDMVLTIFVENETPYDGVYWDDELDVSKLSAPRGVIVADRVHQWRFAGPHN